MFPRITAQVNVVPEKSVSMLDSVPEEEMLPDYSFSIIFQEEVCNVIKL